MMVLYVDTSSSYLYTGIVNNNVLLKSIKKEFNSDLSTNSLFEIEKMFSELNLVPNDIDKIIVVSGPGSFTGIRIGMTFSKVLSWSLKKEITTITSLEAMAISYDSKELKIPIIDARRGYVYAGIYLNDNNLLVDQYIKLTDLNQKVLDFNKPYTYITNNQFLELNNIKPYEPNILKIVLKYQNKPSINPHLVEPTYLKLTEAEEKYNDI